MTATKPYTYLVGWTSLNKFYYGVRYAENCLPCDLWKSYFTSSKNIKMLREKYGEPDIIKVRKIFKDKTSAQIWEKKVLTRLKVLKNDKWLNQNIGGIIDINVIKKKLTGRTLSEETKQKMRIAKLGKPKSEQHIQNLKNRIPWNKGKPGLQKHSEETKLKIKEKNLGSVKSEQTKAKISNSLKNRVGA